jgi:hypothetical protein
MSQGVLSFQYEIEKRDGGMTALAGLPAYLEFGHVMGLSSVVSERMGVRCGQGWRDNQMIMALVLLNVAGGDCVDDLRVLESDEGFCRVLKETEGFGLSRRERRGAKRRWRRERRRSVPSPTAAFAYLGEFHDPEQERLREPHRAFIPSSNGHLRDLVRVNADFAASVQRRKRESTATLDMDATLVETHKRGALPCYKHYRAYQPLNTYWAEQDLVVHSEFRDGNVPAGFEQRRVLEEALALLPDGVEKVLLRSDTAGYQEDLLRYCAEGKSERFGVIEFAVGVDVTPEFKRAVTEVEEADWEPLGRVVNGRLSETGQEYAEVCFVPKWVGHKKHGPVYRYLAIRERLREQPLSGMEDQVSFPFPTMGCSGLMYKVTGIVTNRELPGDEVIWWYRERCGKSEAAHGVMKEDLAGGKLPSALFGVNAAWWQIMILAFNLSSAMKRLVLGETWGSSRLKAIRFWLIKLPGRVLTHARRLVVRLVGGHPSNETLFQMRRRIQALSESG